MSISQNNVVREVSPKSLFESALPVLSTACTWNQGDILTFDVANHVLRPVTGADDSINVLGVAVNKVINGIMPSPIQGTAVDGSQAIEDMSGPLYGIVAFMTLNTGDSIFPGDQVYLTSDPQTVTSVPANSSVGIMQGRAVASAPSGTIIDVLMGARYGMDTITF